MEVAEEVYRLWEERAAGANPKERAVGANPKEQAAGGDDSWLIDDVKPEVKARKLTKMLGLDGKTIGGPDAEL